MNRYFFLFILFFIGGNISSFSQKYNPGDARIVQLTPPGKKIRATINTQLHPAARTGKTYFWYDNKEIHETRGGYSGYILDGLYQEFYYPENGLSVRGHYRKGVKHGIWTSWYVNGMIRERERWKRGSLSGRKQYYTSAGFLVRQESYRQGRLHGVAKSYSPDSTAPYIQYFDDGREIGQRRGYFSFLKFKKPSSDTLAAVPDKKSADRPTIWKKMGTWLPRKKQLTKDER